MPLHEHPAPITGVIPGKRLLDVVDLGKLADGGLGSVVGAVVHNELAGSDLVLQDLVLVLGKGLEVPAVISSGQTNIVALLQTEVTVGSSDVAPLAGLDVAQSGADRLRQTLHGRGDERVVSVAVLFHAVRADVVLVNVNAHNVAIVLQGSLNSGGVDAAAAGKDDLSAVGIPALHTRGDVGIAVELAAVEVVDVDVGAQLLCSSVSALHIAVAVTDNGGHSHAAQEAQLGVAILDNGVACQIACLLLLEGDAVAVGGDGIGADIALSHIDGDELDIGILVSSPCQRSAVQVADADDHISAVVDSLTDHGLAVLIGSIRLRDIVLAVVAHVAGDSSPASLVEALIIDRAGIAGQSDLGDLLSAVCCTGSGGRAGSCGRSRACSSSFTGFCLSLTGRCSTC